jgi:hypothetical protein
MSNYPPGFSGRIERWTTIYRCQNNHCPHLHIGHEEHVEFITDADRFMWKVNGYDELGGMFIEDEEHVCCPHCDEEGVDTGVNGDDGDEGDGPEFDYDDAGDRFLDETEDEP